MNPTVSTLPSCSMRGVLWPVATAVQPLAAPRARHTSLSGRREGRAWQTAAMDRAAESSGPDRVDAVAEAAQQRAMIAALASSLNASPVRYWLMGGWAVDAHLGRTTRRHSDIDLAVFLADRAELVDVLAKRVDDLLLARLGDREVDRSRCATVCR